MLQWLRLLVFLLLCAMVRGRDVECDYGYYIDNCWNVLTHLHDKDCWKGNIKHLTVSTDGEVFTIFGKNRNGSHANVENVQFLYGSFTKMPKLIHKSTNEQIVQVFLVDTKTSVKRLC